MDSLATILIIVSIFALSVGLIFFVKFRKERRDRLASKAQHSQSQALNVERSNILESIGDGVIVLGPRANLVFANEMGKQILDTKDAAFIKHIEGAASETAPGKAQHFIEKLNLWVEVQSYPKRDGGVTLLVRDINESRRMETAFRANEERFRKLTDSGVVGVFVVDQTSITEANDLFLNMIGWTREDLVNGSIPWTSLTVGDPKEIYTLFEADHAALELELIRKDEGRISVLFGGTILTKSPFEAIGLALDLTERKKADRRIHCLAEASRILESSLDYETTFQGLMRLLAKDLCEECIALVDEEGMTRSISSSPKEFDSSNYATAIAKVKRTGTAELLSRPDGRACAIVPLPTRTKIDGALLMFARPKVIFDNDDRRLFEEIGRRAGLALQHARLYRSAQDINRLKDEFVAIASHELRTPLTPILGAVYMLRTEPGNPNILNRAIDLIERNAKAQSKIVEDLLDVSRIISGKLRLSMANVDLHTVIKAAVETVRPASEAKTIRIETQLDELDGIVFGDADRLQQVVWNLLANSVKFTPAGGQINVVLHQQAAVAELQITDTGIGIGAEFLPHVFDRFRQADGSRTRAHGGLGLGLAIVRHLVESHGGTVQAASSGDKQGSTFTVKLPLRSVLEDSKTAQAGD